METKETVERRRSANRGPGGSGAGYRFEEKLKAVRLHLQEGFSRDLVCEETGVAPTTLTTWLKDYRAHGRPAYRGRRRPAGARLPRRSRRRYCS
jgi:transposase-like protein